MKNVDSWLIVQVNVVADVSLACLEAIFREIVKFVI